MLQSWKPFAREKTAAENRHENQVNEKAAHATPAVEAGKMEKGDTLPVEAELVIRVDDTGHRVEDTEAPGEIEKKETKWDLLLGEWILLLGDSIPV